MPIRPRHLVVAGAAGFALLLASCNRSPTSPPPSPPTQPPAPAPAVIVRIEIAGPSEIAPGESVQLIANAIKTDGSVEDVSARSQWFPTTSNILQVSSVGLVT